MSNIRSIGPSENAADFLERLVKDYRDGKIPMPSMVAVVGLIRSGESQIIDFSAGPGTLSPIEFIGLLEMGKATFLDLSGQ